MNRRTVAPAIVAVLFVLTVACTRSGAEARPTPTDTPQPERRIAPTATSTPVPTPVGKPTVLVGRVAFSAEVAMTWEEQRRGLAGRDSLARGHGMLFVFEAPSVVPFTMAGMRFPLDFLWISSDLRVADITENAPPSQAEGALYWPRVPVRYVLEVNAGEVEAHGIKLGDSVQFQGIPVEGGI